MQGIPLAQPARGAFRLEGLVGTCHRLALFCLYDLAGLIVYRLKISRRASKGTESAEALNTGVGNTRQRLRRGRVRGAALIFRNPH